MATNIQQALAAARAKVQKLENAIVAKRNRQLATLHKQYGFSSPAAFIKAIKAAVAGKGAAAAPSDQRRKRSVITAETKAKVKALAQAGKTGNEIAKTVGISIPSVQNIKRELGLTRTSKK